MDGNVYNSSALKQQLNSEALRGSTCHYSRDLQDRIASLSLMSLNVPCVFIAFPDERSRLVIEEHGLSGRQSSPGHVSAVRTLIEQVANTGKALALSDTPGRSLNDDVMDRHDLGPAAYLGVPLLSGNAPPFGVLAVLDDNQRTWQEREIQILRDLASMAISEAELRAEVDQTEHERQEKLALLESTGEGLYGIDRHARCTFVNRAGADILGYSSEELEGQDMHQLIHHTRPDGTPYPHSECPVLQALQTGRGVHIDDDILWREDGTSFHARYSAFPIREHGMITGAVVTFLDITDHIRSEEALQRSNERITNILESITDGFFSLDHEWRFNYINQQAEQFLQRSRRELLGKNIWEEFPDAINTIFELKYREAVDTQSAVTFDAYFAPLELWVTVHAYPSSEGLSVYFQDTGHRRQAELERERLLEREQQARRTAEVAAGRVQQYALQLRALAEAASVINSQLSLDDSLRLITDRAREIIGASQSIVSIALDKDWTQTVNAVSLPDHFAVWREDHEPPDRSSIYPLASNISQPTRRTQTEFSSHPEWRDFGAESGCQPPVRGWLTAPLKGRDGSNIGLIQLSDKHNGEFTEQDEDIVVQLAQLASVSIQNTRLYQELETAIQAREEFLASAAHELKTPLTTVKGYTQMVRRQLRRADSNPKRLETIVRELENQASRLEALMADIVDAFRIQQGTPRLRMEEFDLARLARRVLIRCEHVAERTRLHRLVFDASSPVVGVWDQERLDQVLTNLISNALKFSPSGGEVAVRVGLQDGNATIQVSDQGIGITAEDQKFLFHPFMRNDSVRGPVPGTGLGLYITARIVEEHGGKIDVESEPGVGSTFTIQLPLTPPD